MGLIYLPFTFTRWRLTFDSWQWDGIFFSSPSPDRIMTPLYVSFNGESCLKVWSSGFLSRRFGWRRYLSLVQVKHSPEQTDILKLETKRYSDTSEDTYNAARCKNPQDSHLNLSTGNSTKLTTHLHVLSKLRILSFNSAPLYRYNFIFTSK